MNFRFHCKNCGLVRNLEISVATKPDDWDPPESVECLRCNGQATRVFGTRVAVQENRDQMKHIGSSLSNQRGVEFVGKGFPDVERKLDAEQKEISDIMDEPVSEYDIQAGYEQMAQLEQERDKPVGFYSGKREQEEVEKEIDGKIVKKMSTKKRGAEALKKDVEKAKVLRGD